MANRQYVGARYVPKFYQGSNGNEWESGVVYEALTMVTYLSNTYCSKKPVPARTVAPNLDTEYWVLTAAYSSQVAELREEVEDIETTIGDANGGIIKSINDINAEQTIQNNQITELNNFKNSFDIINGTTTGSVAINANENAIVGTIVIPANKNAIISANLSMDGTTQSEFKELLGSIDTIDSTSISTGRNLYFSVPIRELGLSSGVEPSVTKIVGRNSVDTTYYVKIKNTTSNTLNVYPFINALVFHKGIDITPYVSIPEFYREYVNARILEINSKNNLSDDSFIFCSDLHNENNHYSTAIARKIIQDTSTKKLVYGGDYINEPNSTQLVISLLMDRIPYMRTKLDDVFLVGNHDDGHYSANPALTKNQLFTILDQPYSSINPNISNTYFYVDNTNKKIRYFYLDTGNDGILDNTQLNWLQTKVNELNSEWYYIFIQHMSVDTTFNNRTPTSYYSVISQEEPIINNSSATFIGIVSGHTHIDITDTSKGFNIICTTCDAHGIQASSMSNDNRTVGTINEQAFDVFHIDLVHRKLYSTRIGGGQYNVIGSTNLNQNDREVSF